MHAERQKLRAACRAAYERGRVRSALWEAAPVLPMTLLALLATGHLISLVVGVILMAAAAVMAWRGGDAARGVSPGLAGGALLVTIPLLAQQCAVVCVGPLCWSSCITACAVAGVGAGVVVARSWPADAPLQQRLASLTLASLAGAMGCIEIGIVGLGCALLMLALSGSALAVGRR